MNTTDVAPSGTTAELHAAGRRARDGVPRSAHAAWSPAPDRPRALDTLARDDAGRLADLLPIRYGRMAASPFAFFRGSASIMASDLQDTPSSGLHVPIAGDAHLANFGCYASPERRLVFDVNDFDETLEGPWEWDVKRLAASVTIAARHLLLKRRDAREATGECVRSYAEHMREYAERRQLAVWYAAIDEDRLAGLVQRTSVRNRSQAPERDSEFSEHVVPKFVDLDGTPCIEDAPPLVFHPPDRAAFLEETRALLAAYDESLTPDRRQLLARFRLADAAYKVVGVGSVGTRCLVALLMADAGDPLLLQVKEARASVFERYTAPSPYAGHGERVVVGQRLLQARSDIFLGWARASDGSDFYVRLLADWKASIDVDSMTAEDLGRYASLCGWALARAHARASGRAAWISGYLGRGDAFAAALETFAETYADRSERDYDDLLAAIAAGRIAADTKTAG